MGLINGNITLKDFWNMDFPAALNPQIWRLRWGEHRFDWR